MIRLPRINPASGGRILDWAREVMDTLKDIDRVLGSIGLQTAGRKEDVLPPPGPRLHVLELEDLIPDPLKITADVLDTVTTEAIAALPSPGAIAAIITAPLSAAASNGTAPASVAAAVAALFSGALAAVAGAGALVNELIEDINPIKNVLETYFNGPDAKRPRNGDYIYTEIAGIVYILFRQENEIPSGNTIFRVPFEINYGTPAAPHMVTWVAMTLVPAPDLGALVKQIIELALKLLQSMIAAVVDAAVQGVSAGLIALHTVIQDILEEILAIWDAINNLTDGIGGFDPSGILSRLGNLEAWKDVIVPDVAAIKALTDARLDVTVLGADGVEKTINVFTAANGADKKVEITWITSHEGAGRKATFIVLSAVTSNTTNVDWREHFYLDDGLSSKVTKVLTMIGEGYPKANPDGETYELHSVDVCEEGEEESETIQVVKKSGED